jgi:nicotinate (nicotinamide) nucleotide adenylyltransferase
MKIGVYGGSFNPPGNHHRKAIKQILNNQLFDEIFIIPCGYREDKPPQEQIPLHQKSWLVHLAFSNLLVKIDTTDIDQHCFTPTFQVQERYERQHPNSEIWHIVGADIITGGATGQSEIQRTWRKGPEIWNSLNFAIMKRPGHEIKDKDLPPRSMLIELPLIHGSSTEIRNLLQQKQPITGMVQPAVEEFIYANNLYQEEIQIDILITIEKQGEKLLVTGLRKKPFYYDPQADKEERAIGPENILYLESGFSDAGNIVLQLKELETDKILVTGVDKEKCVIQIEGHFTDS